MGVTPAVVGAHISFWVHTFWLLLVFGASVWNGARYCTSYYMLCPPSGAYNGFMLCHVDSMHSVGVTVDVC